MPPIMTDLTGMEAVKSRIKLAELARLIGVTRGAVGQWDKVPAERMGDVARLTGISMEILRPDLFEAAERQPSQREGAAA